MDYSCKNICKFSSFINGIELSNYPIKAKSDLSIAKLHIFNTLCIHDVTIQQ